MLIDQLALAAAAAVAGIAFYISAVQQPARLGLDDRSMLKEWTANYKGAAAIQAPLALVGGVFGILSFVLTTDWLWLLGSLALLANVPYTLMVIQPVNAALMAMDLDAPGEGLRKLIEQWGRLHWNRTFLGMGAAVLFLWANL